MNIEKTTIFTVDDKTIVVADLNTGLRKQFELYDAFRQELADRAVQFEMANTAVTVKQMQLQEIIRQTLNPPKPAEEAKAEAANG